ncbi:MAG: hypothetical protein WBC44_07090 [Planctomycetaceae bacterium]
MSSLLHRLTRGHTIADGTAAAIVRIALVAAAVGILTIGLAHLPSIATTQGEMAVGLVLSLLVASQIFVAALWFPLGSRR